MTTCDVRGCDKSPMCRGLCPMHYQRLRVHGDVNYARPTAIQRFWRKVDVRGADDCWEWSGATNSSGYGQITVRTGLTVYAHRLSAAIHFGMFDQRLWVLHHCDNRRCVNPAHLYLGTVTDNVRDMLERGRSNNYWARQTQCVHGHEYTPENTYVVKCRDGVQRSCRECNRLRYLRKKAKASL